MLLEAQDRAESAGSATGTFGRYQLLEAIATGGMAEVFKARQDGAAGTEKLVCIKRILPSLSSNGDFISLFVKEAKISLPLTHGNITQVYDFGEVDGVYYLAMEYMSGKNVAQILSRVAQAGSTLDIDTALYCAAEVCRGLQYAHGFTDSKGQPVVVVHRDVSPHNVLISYAGQVKLTDFGIAFAASQAQVSDEAVRGKPCYISPEQAAGGSGDPRSDIFALGTMIYEMLTGSRVFEAATDAGTLRNVQQLVVSPPSSVNGAIDSEIDAIVLKAMAKDPSERYQRAADLLVELTRVLHARAPYYTADTMAAQVKELFAWELSAEQGGSSADSQRDRLLMQLSRAGVKVDTGNPSKDELLSMGTVAIDAPRSEAASRSRLLILALLACLLVGGAISATIWVSRRSAGGQMETPDATIAAPQDDPTDHLTPKSLRLRQDEPVVGAAGDHPASAPSRSGAASPMATSVTSNKPAVTASAERAAKVARRAGFGYVNLNSWPWSIVYVDGRRVKGNTPLYRVKVTSGRHRIKFVNPELGLSREVTVVIASGKQRTVAVKLHQ